MYKNTPDEVGSDFVKLKTRIVTKTKVPTEETSLFKNPESNPTILFVAAAINPILVIIRKVAPPFATTKVCSHVNNPSSKIET